jgi:hypothetical protein
MAAHTHVAVGYNVQIAVDAKHKLIVEQQVTNQVVDMGLLAQTAEPAKERLTQGKVQRIRFSPRHVCMFTDFRVSYDLATAGPINLGLPAGAELTRHAAMGTARSAALRKAPPFHPDVECARRVPQPTFGGAPRGRSSI